MSQQAPAFIVVAHIAEAIQPSARGAKYEDPLDAALKGAGLGSVNGGGSLLSAQLQVESVDIELALRDLDGALQFARTILLTLGAPRRLLCDEIIRCVAPELARGTVGLRRA